MKRKQKHEVSIPGFDLKKIQYSVDSSTYEKALDLFQKGKVTNFVLQPHDFSAIVKGSHAYQVFVSKTDFYSAYCDCYLGLKDILCKHIVAVALYAVLDGKMSPDVSLEQRNAPTASRIKSELSTDAVRSIRKNITGALRYIKSYDGPSRTWFAYQDSLFEGCARLSDIFSELPVGKASAELVVDTLLRLDKKISGGGVDDSDGTVGECMLQSVDMLLEFTAIFPECQGSFERLRDIETCFGWEEKLVKATTNFKEKESWQTIVHKEEKKHVWNDALSQVEVVDAFWDYDTMVNTGMGGTGQSFRYEVVLSPLGSVKFNKQIQTKVLKTLTNLSTKSISIESTVFVKTHITLTLLLDAKLALDSVVRKYVDGVNKAFVKPLLRSHYLATNVRPFSVSDIHKYLTDIQDYNRTDWK